MGKSLPLALSSTRISDLRCHVYHHYRHVMRRVPYSRRDPLIAGTVFHKFLEAWLAAPFDEDLPSAVAALYLAAQNTNLIDDPFKLAALECTAATYHSRWQTHHRTQLETVCTEQWFEVPMREWISSAEPEDVFCGRIDAIVRDAQERYWILEHKTTSSKIDPTSSYWDRLALDSQISAYYLGARSLGYNVSGVIYDVIRLPATRRLNATPAERIKYTKAGKPYAGVRVEDESLEDFKARVFVELESGSSFERRTVVRLESEIQRSRDDIVNAYELTRWLEQRADSQSGARSMLRNDKACHQYGECEYFNVCNSTASIGDNLLFQTRKARGETNGDSGNDGTSTSETFTASDFESRESDPWEDPDAF